MLFKVCAVNPVFNIPEVHIHGNLLVGVWLGMALGVKFVQCIVAGTQDDQRVGVVRIGETVLEKVKRSSHRTPFLNMHPVPLLGIYTL